MVVMIGFCVNVPKNSKFKEKIDVSLCVYTIKFVVLGFNELTVLMPLEKLPAVFIAPTKSILIITCFMAKVGNQIENMKISNEIRNKQDSSI